MINWPRSSSKAPRYPTYRLPLIGLRAASVSVAVRDVNPSGRRPLNLGGFKIAKPQESYSLFLILYRALTRATNEVGCCDQQPAREDLAPRLGKEFVHIALGDPVCSVVSLRLDRPEVSVSVFGDQADAGVATPPPRSLIPQPHTPQLMGAAPAASR